MIATNSDRLSARYVRRGDRLVAVDFIRDGQGTGLRRWWTSCCVRFDVVKRPIGGGSESFDVLMCDAKGLERLGVTTQHTLRAALFDANAGIGLPIMCPTSLP